MEYELAKNLLILGTGGHSKVATEIAEIIGFKKITYLDPNNQNKSFNGYSLVNKIEDYNEYFFVAIGDNFLREKVYIDFINSNRTANYISLIHPKACISKKSKIGKGSLIMPICIINCDVIIGRGVILNTSSTIDHDCHLSDFSSIAPGVNLGGNVIIGKRTAILIGSSIKHNITIGNDVVIGGKSMVLENIDDLSLAYGNPAKFIKKRTKTDKYL